MTLCRLGPVGVPNESRYFVACSFGGRAPTSLMISGAQTATSTRKMMKPSETIATRSSRSRRQNNSSGLRASMPPTSASAVGSRARSMVLVTRVCPLCHSWPGTAVGATSTALDEDLPGTPWSCPAKRGTPARSSRSGKLHLHSGPTHGCIVDARLSERLRELLAHPGEGLSDEPGDVHLGHPDLLRDLCLGE